MILQTLTKSCWRVLALSTLICGTLYSCKESKDSIVTSEKASVRIQVLGVENPELTTKKASGKGRNMSEPQKQVIPFTKSSFIEATLTDEFPVASTNQLRASSGTRAAVTEERTPLAAGVCYMIYVYDSNGAFVTSKGFKNLVDNTAEISLVPDQTYTFVAISRNINNYIGLEAAGNSSLSTAVFEGGIENSTTPSAFPMSMMYFKKNLTVHAGDNQLDVVLKHLTSQVTVNYTMATDMTGNIENFAYGTISPSYLNATCNLSDGTLTYNGNGNLALPVVYNTSLLPARTLAFSPRLLLNPGTSTGVYTISSITIDGETKNGLTIPNLSIIPGQRYNLNLNFKTCTQPVTGGANLSWAYPASGTGAVVDGATVPAGTVLEQNLTAPGADYGFVFDIQRLDNSFNMVVNGIQLATQEIQFENIGVAPKNVQFVDGSNYGETVNGVTVPQIFNMLGTATNPILRVVISRTGEVTMYGSKSAGGELFPLKLTQGSFNTVPWSATSNAVKITQIVQGATSMVGSGSGRKKIACTS